MRRRRGPELGYGVAAGARVFGGGAAHRGAPFIGAGDPRDARTGLHRAEAAAARDSAPVRPQVGDDTVAEAT